MYFQHGLCSFRYKVLEQAVKILVKEEVLKEKKELLDEAVMQLLPFMIITNANSKSSDWKMAVCLSESDLCSLHPLLKGWPEAFEEAVKSTKSAELVGVANEKIILLLSGNLTSGDPSLLLQMVRVPWYPDLKKFYFSGGDCNRTNVI